MHVNISKDHKLYAVIWEWVCSPGFWLGCKCGWLWKAVLDRVCLCLWGNSYCNVSLHCLGRRASHAPTGRFGNSVRKWTNKGVYSPWERGRFYRRERGGVFLGWVTTVTDNLSVCMSISRGVLVFPLACCQHYHGGSSETGCFLISVIL